MRKYFFIMTSLLLVVILTSCGLQKYEEKFTFSPENPSPGDEITVYYNPEGTLLADADEIDLIVYSYSSEINSTQGIEMTKDEEGWKANFVTAGDDYGVVVKFRSGEQEESNDKKGYWINLYKNGGVIPGMLAGKANIYSRYAHYAGVDRDFTLANETFKKAFEQNPEIKSEHLDNYLFMLNRSKIEGYNNIIRKELKDLEAKGDLDEAEMAILAEWYGNVNKNRKAEKYTAKLLTEYPNGEFAQKKRVNQIYREQDVNSKIEMLKKFESEYPENESIAGIYNSIVIAYGNTLRYKESKAFLSDNIKKIDTYRYYALANKITDEKGDADLALDIAKMGMIRGRQALDNPESPKPKDLTIDEWETDRKYYLALNMYEYGAILYEMGKTGELLPILDEAVTLSIDYYIPQGLIDLYSKVVVESGKYETALSRIGGFIEKGKNSETVMEALKEAFTKKNGSDNGFEEYLGQYEAAAELALLTKLKKEMINNPSVPFTLKDLEGNDVSLSDFKGKIVIIDFWATWCPPCKASFPAMKIAVEKYVADEEVKFLFVDTWERVPNKRNNAANFIRQNNYPFHVLLDDEFKVIGSYKVQSIPTKFILDKDGNIRFQSVGFSGNIDHLVKEIDIMIDLLKEV
ncbi:redoxin domain-containing protein [Bacteroidota bacterium]